MVERRRMTGPLRLALVGAGRIGRLHAEAIRRSPALDLVAVAEPRDHAAAAVAGEGVRRTRDIEGLLRERDFDAAIVSAPTALHLRLAGALIADGVPVLCEKPAGLTSEHARELGERARVAGVPLFVGYWRRFVPALSDLRERLATGMLGAATLVHCAQWDERPPPPAFRDPAISGGIFVDMGVHEFDTLRWLLGQEIEDIGGVPSAVVSDRPVPGDPEAVVLAARLSGGTAAVVTLARRHPPGDLCRVELLATEAVETITYLEPPRSEDQMIEALAAQADGFATALTQDDGVIAGAGDAAAALEAAERARASVGAA
jgi:myo-inositol 2-dehydrogenase / D-chiro-inositol 1-dehydrogenase